MTAPQWAAWTPRPTHPRATAALVTGIVAISGFVTLVTFAAGPVAWYLGLHALREMDREPDRWEGRSSARAGLVLGLVATAVLALLLAAGALVVVGVVSLSTIDVGY